MENFWAGITIINGADDVFSLRKKELLWQYQLPSSSVTD